MEAFRSAYVACISRRGSTYHAYCEPCFEEWRAKSLGDAPEDTGSGKEDYDIPEIVKACRMLRMKLLVEGGPLAEAIVQVEKDKDRNTRRLTPTDALAMMVWCFPLVLNKIATREFSGRNRADYSEYEKHRMELFVKCARLLRPFLKRITGKMIGRIYNRNLDEMRRKHGDRSERNNWRGIVAKRPARLFPLTSDPNKLAETLRKLLPKSSCAVVPRGSGETWSERQERENKLLAPLGLESENDKAYYTSLTITVHNSRKGPRFVIRID
jgi:hypothetical protein